jgi:ectoine hydroxylase-related dioxygenase (phytanoyl-CoA dioxygenase family)
MTAAQQRAFFEEQGYLVVEGLLTPEEVARCQAEIERLHHVAAELEAEGDPASSYFQREPYAEGANRGDVPVLRKIEGTGKFSAIFRDLAAHSQLIEVVQDLIGSPDLLQFRSTLMLKPAFHGSAHALHQDSAYWPMDPPTLVTVSIALNDATRENGCFQVIPGSHHWGLQEWGRISRDKHEALTDRSDVDQSGKIEVPLKAGSALFFHSLMVHGSGPNNSPHSRNTALYAYFPPTVRYVPRKGGSQTATYRVVAGLGGREELTLTAAGMMR